MAHPNRHLITLHGNTCSLTDPEGRSFPIPNKTWRKPTVLPRKKSGRILSIPEDPWDERYIYLHVASEEFQSFHPIIPQKLRPLRTTKTWERIPATFQGSCGFVPWTVKLQLFISTEFSGELAGGAAKRWAQEGPLARGKTNKSLPSGKPT